MDFEGSSAAGELYMADIVFSEAALEDLEIKRQAMVRAVQEFATAFTIVNSGLDAVISERGEFPDDSVVDAGRDAYDVAYGTIEEAYGILGSALYPQRD